MATIEVPPGSSSSGLIIRPGTELLVESGGTAEAMHVVNGGMELVQLGGQDFGAVVAGADLVVDGTASGEVVLGDTHGKSALVGLEQVSGTAFDTKVRSGGLMQGPAAGWRAGATSTPAAARRWR